MNSHKGGGEVTEKQKKAKTIAILGVLFFVVISFATLYSKLSYSTVNLCRCIFEKPYTEYMRKNKRSCDKAISREIGVSDWRKVNLFADTEAGRKFDQLSKRCR